jgi:hypothetical protein
MASGSLSGSQAGPQRHSALVDRKSRSGWSDRPSSVHVADNARQCEAPRQGGTARLSGRFRRPFRSSVACPLGGSSPHPISEGVGSFLPADLLHQLSETPCPAMSEPRPPASVSFGGQLRCPRRTPTRSCRESPMTSRQKASPTSGARASGHTAGYPSRGLRPAARLTPLPYPRHIAEGAPSNMAKSHRPKSAPDFSD